MLGETWIKKGELKLLVFSMDITGLVKLVDESHSWSLLHYDLEFCKTHSQAKDKLRGPNTGKSLKHVGICPMVVMLVLLDGNDWDPLNHLLVWASPGANSLIPWLEGNHILAEHIGAGSLVGATKRLEILMDVGKGLLRVCNIPLGSVLAVEDVIVICLLRTLNV